MAPGTEFTRDFCAGIGQLQIGVVLVFLFLLLLLFTVTTLTETSQLKWHTQITVEADWQVKHLCC